MMTPDAARDAVQLRHRRVIWVDTDLDPSFLSNRDDLLDERQIILGGLERDMPIGTPSNVMSRCSAAPWRLRSAGSCGRGGQVNCTRAVRSGSATPTASRRCLGNGQHGAIMA
ncbi:MAG: hypothetical protein ACP5HS_08115 [Anaerolineae bacterium]